jgi:hypothetical protein
MFAMRYQSFAQHILKGRVMGISCPLLAEMTQWLPMKFDILGCTDSFGEFRFGPS